MAGYQIRNQYHTHYLTLTIVGWADIFTRKNYKDIIIDSLAYCQKEKGFIIYAYVIMSNHLHLIATAKESSKGLSAILGDFKRHTAKQIIKAIKTQPESRREWLLRAVVKVSSSTSIIPSPFTSEKETLVLPRWSFKHHSALSPPVSSSKQILPSLW